MRWAVPSALGEPPSDLNGRPPHPSTKPADGSSLAGVAPSRTPALTCAVEDPVETSTVYSRWCRRGVLHSPQGTGGKRQGAASTGVELHVSGGRGRWMPLAALQFRGLPLASRLATDTPDRWVVTRWRRSEAGGHADGRPQQQRPHHGPVARDPRADEPRPPSPPQLHAQPQRAFPEPK